MRKVILAFVVTGGALAPGLMFGGADVVNNAPVQSYDVKPAGFTITLLDGQVWQQTEDDADKKPVRWYQPASSMRVTISQGAMRSFNLVMGDENTHIR